MKTQRNMASLTAALITFGSLAGGANGAVTLTSREASSVSQTIPSSALDFLVTSSTGLSVEKDGGPVTWTYGNGAFVDGNSPQSISWSGGSPVPSGTSNTTTYFGLGPNYGAQRVGAASISFAVNSPSLSTIDLTLHTLPNGNTGVITYDYAVLVNNIVQYSQSSVSDSQLNLEIFKFQISDLSQGDTVTFRVNNALGSNGWHNFAFVGAEIDGIPEPSVASFLAGMVVFTVFRRRKN